MLLEFFFLFGCGVMISYMFRHYVFSFTAIKTQSENLSINNHISLKPSVSILIPAHDEENVIERLLQRLTELTYPKNKLEVIVIDDHSADRTGEIAEVYASRYPDFIKVVHRNPGGNGKSEALNEGLRYSTGKIICCLDADYLPERGLLEKTLPYLSDSAVGIVQSRITVLNEHESLVSRIVALERIGGYRVNQYARDRLKLVPQYAGTTGLIRRQLLLSLGGFNPNILAEDTDLTLRVLLAGFQVRYVDYAESKEEAVATLRQYWHQRSRWSKGHMQCAFNYLLPLLRNQNISLRQKLDAFMLLNIYFLPILVLVSWILSLTLFVFRPSTWLPYEMALVTSIFFTLSGTIAPLLEVIAAAYMLNRKRLILFSPILIVAYIVNVFICSKAILDLLFSKIARKNPNRWHKTTHKGRISVQK